MIVTWTIVIIISFLCVKSSSFVSIHELLFKSMLFPRNKSLAQNNNSVLVSSPKAECYSELAMNKLLYESKSKQKNLFLGNQLNKNYICYGQE